MLYIDMYSADIVSTVLPPAGTLHVKMDCTGWPNMVTIEAAFSEVNLIHS